MSTSFDVEQIEKPSGLLRTAIRMKRTQIGLGILVLMIGLTIVGPIIAPHSQTAFIDMPNSLNIPGALFGTDYLGQDVLVTFLDWWSFDSAAVYKCNIARDNCRNISWLVGGNY